MSSAIRARATTLLASAPIALPQLLALLVVIVASASEGGYPLAHWAPAAVATALLLLVALVALPRRTTRPPLSAVAITGLVGLALWSALSITWAADEGAAAAATTRTAFLAATFTLFAYWQHRPRSALTVLTAATFALGLVTWVTVISLLVTTDIDPWFFYDRLLEPVGYVNAGAAFWGIISFLGVGLAGGRIAPALRVAGALIAVPAAALSFLCLSRGGLLAAAATMLLLLVALPGRARNAAAFAVIGAPLAIALPVLADVGNAARLDPNAIEVVHHAMVRTITVALLAALLTAAWVIVDQRVALDDRRRHLGARAGGIAVGGVIALCVALFAANIGPVTRDRAADALKTIKSTSYNAVAPGQNRLTADLSSGRWQFWVVGWDQFQRDPWHGAGADNFRQDFLLHGSGSESPAYPHSLAMRTLGQLGLGGAALMLMWLIPVLIAIRRLAAGRDAAGRAIAVAAGGAFTLWLLHGMVDWLLEYGGLTAIVAALSGLLVAAAPPLRSTAPRRRRVTLGRHARPLTTAAAVTLLLVAAAWTAAQWLSERYRSDALSLSVHNPQRAVEKAEQARRLDPFGIDADNLLGQLAISRGDHAAASQAYLASFARNRGATAPRLWLGVIASSEGDARNAKRWLRRAIRTAPRDPLPRVVYDHVKAGEQLDPAVVLRELLARRRALTADPDPLPPGATPPPAPAGPTPEPAPIAADS